MRADVYLFEKGLCESRSRASESIKNGLLYVNGKSVTQASYDVKDCDEVELRGTLFPYVGRGGLKLSGAMEVFSLSASGLTCVDIGASTGGFTDVLLRDGAVKVYAVDCGVGQLHKSLLDDKRVVNIEGFNARELTISDLGEKCDMAVMDVSFISQTLLHKAVCRVLKEGGIYVTLIKPQFEVGRENIGHGGIVKSEEAHILAIRRVLESAAENGLKLNGLTVSPIKGGDGNREYIACFTHGGEARLEPDRAFLKQLVKEKK